MKVLIADDNKQVRNFIKMVLKTPIKQLECIECVNGEEAVEKFIAERPDIILMDIMMEKMDGLTAMKKIRELSVEQKVIIISQLSEDEYRQPALEAGAAAYLNKEQLLKLPVLMNQVLSVT